jgi:hypothetical protein
MAARSASRAAQTLSHSRRDPAGSEHTPTVPDLSARSSSPPPDPHRSTGTRLVSASACEVRIVHAVDGRSRHLSATERSAVALDRRRTSSIRQPPRPRPAGREVSPDGAQLGITYWHEKTSQAPAYDLAPDARRRQPRMRLADVAWRGTSSVAVATTDPVDGVGHALGHLPLRPRTDIAI